MIINSLTPGNNFKSMIVHPFFYKIYVLVRVCLNSLNCIGESFLFPIQSKQVLCFKISIVKLYL